MNECIFCKIANREVQSKILYKNDDVIAFEDLNPVAPIHILIIPKTHISNILELANSRKSGIMKSVLNAVNFLCNKYQLDSSGFRLVNNCGKNGGQLVDHLHFHFLGGRQMNWPPG